MSDKNISCVCECKTELSSVVHPLQFLQIFSWLSKKRLDQKPRSPLPVNVVSRRLKLQSFLFCPFAKIANQFNDQIEIFNNSQLGSGSCGEIANVFLQFTFELNF